MKSINSEPVFLDRWHIWRYRWVNGCGEGSPRFGLGLGRQRMGTGWLLSVGDVLLYAV